MAAAKQKNGSWKYFDIKTDANEEKYVDAGYKVLYIKKAVFTCFCYCDDPNKTQIWYRDGNPANLNFTNLVARLPRTYHTSAATFKLINGLTIANGVKFLRMGLRCQYVIVLATQIQILCDVLTLMSQIQKDGVSYGWTI